MDKDEENSEVVETLPRSRIVKKQVTLETADKDPFCWVEGSYNKSPITIESDPQSRHVKIDTSLDTFFIDRKQLIKALQYLGDE